VTDPLKLEYNGFVEATQCREKLGFTSVAIGMFALCRVAVVVV
jgi:hypothetical protein